MSDTEAAAREAVGGYECPYCGLDYPHGLSAHTRAALIHHQANNPAFEKWVRETFIHPTFTSRELDYNRRYGSWGGEREVGLRLHRVNLSQYAWYYNDPLTRTMWEVWKASWAATHELLDPRTRQHYGDEA